jgi:hypothetical protein
MGYEFPDWFKAYHKPVLYVHPPDKQFERFETIQTVGGYNFHHFNLSKLPEGTTHISVEADLSDSDCECDDEIDVQIKFEKCVGEDNPYYDRQYKDYLNEMKEHENKLAEWERLLMIWNAEQEKNKEERDVREYKRLKEKYEGNEHKLSD